MVCFGIDMCKFGISVLCGLVGELEKCFVVIVDKRYDDV